MRHVIIGGLAERLAVEAASRQEATLAASTPSELPTSESLVAVRGPTDVGTERLREFHALVRDYLHAHGLYEKTRDPAVRRVADAIEKQLQAELGWLAADFAAADAAAAEGGGL